MAKANKKQRHEAKRKAKKLQARRREAISPIKRLAEASGELECWMSDGFEEFGQMQIFAYKSAGGLTGIAAFLVDEGVVGLKDAWHDISVDRAMLESMIHTWQRECSASYRRRRVTRSSSSLKGRSRTNRRRRQ